MVVRLPHDHRHETRFALGDPTLVVLVEPFGEPGRLTQLAVGHVRQCRRVPAPTLSSESRRIDVRGQDHGVDHVDHTVGRLDIGGNHRGAVDGDTTVGPE